MKKTNELYLPNGIKIQLNIQQQQAIKEIHKFLKSKERYFLLSGFAGTGKTTVIKKILDDYSGKAIVSAPTRKANVVISQATMLEGFTIHSLLGLQPDVSLEDFNPNLPIFGQIKKASIGRYNLVVIDEASMINEALFELINTEVVTSLKTKIIFLGDDAQIPPVGEKQSAVFMLENNFHLTKQMRQSEDNPVADLTISLRDMSQDLPEFITNRDSVVNDEGEGIIFVDTNEEFRDKVKQSFSSSYAKTNPNYVKLIAWRNKTVMLSNKIIRELVFGKDANLIEKGDILTGYRAVKGNVKESFLINNCVDYKVINVSEKEKNVNGLFGYSVKILEKSKQFRGFDEKEIFIIDSEDEDNLHNYAEMHDNLLAVARADKLWNVYYNFRKKNMLMQDIIEHRNGEKREQNKCIKKDLDYGFAITAHKSQGSTYNKTFILLSDMLLNKNKQEMQQMLYVSLTRASKQTIIR